MTSFLKRIDFRFLGIAILTWSIINLVLNSIGSVLTLALRVWRNEREYYFFDPFWDLRNIGFQTLIFLIVVSIAQVFKLKNSRSLLTYAIFQLLIFHVAFFVDLQNDENGLTFVASVPSWNYTYLELCGQKLVDIISVFYPMMGIFDDGMFVPNDLFRFYIDWIFFTLIYFVGITLLTQKVVSRIY